MAMVAAEAWTMQVSSAPMATKRSTDQKPKPPSEAMPCSRPGYSLRLGMAPFSRSMPTNKRARPMTVWPIDLRLSLRPKMRNMLTAARNMGRLNWPELSPRPRRVMIHAVTVVPMLAPIITATAPARERRPALTKLTTMTVVAEDDWMAAVTAVPVRIPLIGLLVILPRMARILLPATFCRPSLINFMAKRNTASAPAKLMAISRMSVKLI